MAGNKNRPARKKLERARPARKLSDMPEVHPLKPFLPANARLLMLGTFPPKRARWCMDFYYPNPSNDMWRIFGLAFCGDRDFFWIGEEKRFDRRKIEKFLEDEKIALYDTAEEVERLRDNASDNFLKIARPTDIKKLLARIPECRAVACTGAKAAETAAQQLGCIVPAAGDFVQIEADGRALDFYRMPSSSRAYPMKLADKAAAYEKMFARLGLLEK